MSHAPTPMKLRLEKDRSGTTFCPWTLRAPEGFQFAADPSIHRTHPHTARMFYTFDRAREYVADGRAQRAIIPVSAS